MTNHVVELVEPSLVFDPGDPLTSAKQFAEVSYKVDGTRVLQHHRGVFYHWTGANYTELDDAYLRAQLYHFLAPAMHRGKNGIEPFKPNTTKVGKVTRAQLEDIATTKMPDLTAADMDAAVRTIAGTARSMGLETEGVK